MARKMVCDYCGKMRDEKSGWEVVVVMDMNRTYDFCSEECFASFFSTVNFKDNYKYLPENELDEGVCSNCGQVKPLYFMKYEEKDESGELSYPVGAYCSVECMMGRKDINKVKE